jgi:hypothetical protein
LFFFLNKKRGILSIFNKKKKKELKLKWVKT